MKIKTITLNSISDAMLPLLQRNVFDKFLDEVTLNSVKAYVQEVNEDVVLFNLELSVRVNDTYVYPWHITISYIVITDDFGYFTFRCEDLEDMIYKRNPAPIRDIMYEIRAYMLNEGAELIKSEDLLQSTLGKRIYVACHGALVRNINDRIGYKVLSFDIDGMHFTDLGVYFRATIKLSINDRVEIDYDCKVAVGINPGDASNWNEIVSVCSDTVSRYVFN